MTEVYGFDWKSESLQELKQREISRREFLIWMTAAITGLVFAVIGGPQIKQAIQKFWPQVSTTTTTIPALDYETLSINWWQWIETKDSRYQPSGIVFLPGMTGGYTEHTISAKAGDRLFFSAAKYEGPINKDDIDNKVTYEVSFGNLPVLYVGEIKTEKTFTSVIEGANSISHGHWYISEPLKAGNYIGITQGRVPTGNFWEKTKYDITTTTVN